MMTYLFQTPFTVSAACMRIMGHAMAAQIQVATILTKSALGAPFQQVHRVHMMASRPSKPASKRKATLSDGGPVAAPVPAPRPVAVASPSPEVAPKPAPEKKAAPKPKAKAAPKAPVQAAEPAPAPAAKAVASPAAQPAKAKASPAPRKPRAPSMPPAMPERVTKH